MRAGPRGQFACVLGISLLVGLPAALTMASYQAATFDEAGDIFGDSEFVVLEPETWVGKRFPLLKYIDIGNGLAEGRWVVILYAHGCRNCQDLVPDFVASTLELGARLDSLHVAVVEIPPYGDVFDNLIPDSRCVLGRVQEGREWFVTLPVVLVLDHGVVVEVGRESALGRQERAEDVMAAHDGELIRTFADCK